MFPFSQNAIMGTGIIALCLMLWSRDRWYLDQTRKGQRLVAWYGPDRAIWVLRAMLLAGIAFGALLANSIIRPIQW